MLLSDVPLLLQVVAVLHLLFHSLCVAQQGDDLVAMRTTLNLLHDVVTKVISQTFEDGVLREIDELIFSFIVRYLDLQ
jgi:hypothetical protein